MKINNNKHIILFLLFLFGYQLFCQAQASESKECQDIIDRIERRLVPNKKGDLRIDKAQELLEHLDLCDVNKNRLQDRNNLQRKIYLALNKQKKEQAETIKELETAQTRAKKLHQKVLSSIAQSYYKEAEKRLEKKNHTAALQMAKMALEIDSTNLLPLEVIHKVIHTKESAYLNIAYPTFNEPVKEVRLSKDNKHALLYSDKQLGYLDLIHDRKRSKPFVISTNSNLIAFEFTNNNRIFTATEEGRIELKTIQGISLFKFDMLQPDIEKAVLSEDEKQLFVIDKKNQGSLWKLNDNAPAENRGNWDLGGDRIIATKFIENDHKFIISYRKRTIVTLNLNNRLEKDTIKLPEGKKFRNIEAIDFSKNGQFCITVENGDKIEFWRLVEGTSATLINELPSFKMIHAIDADNQLIVVEKNGGLMALVDAFSGSVMSQFTGHIGPINDFVSSNNGHEFLTAGSDQSIRFWQPITTLENLQFEKHQKDITQVEISSNAKYPLALSSEADKSIIWDLKSGKIKSQFDGTDLAAFATTCETGMKGQFQNQNVLLKSIKLNEAHGYEIINLTTQKRLFSQKITGKISSLRFTPNNLAAIIATEEGQIYIQDLSTNYKLTIIDLPIQDLPNYEAIHFLDFQFNSTDTLAVVAIIKKLENAELALFNIGESKWMSTFKGIANTAIFYENGKQLILGKQNGQISFWDITDKKYIELDTMELNQAAIWRIQQYQQKFYVLTRDSMLNVFKIQSGKLRKIPEQSLRFQELPTSLALAKKNEIEDYLVIGFQGGGVKNFILQEDSRPIPFELNGTSRPIAKVDMSLYPDVFTLSEDKILGHWNIETGHNQLGAYPLIQADENITGFIVDELRNQQFFGTNKGRILRRVGNNYLNTFKENHKGSVLAMDVWEDGSFIVSGGEDQDILLWSGLDLMERLSITTSDSLTNEISVNNLAFLPPYDSIGGKPNCFLFSTPEGGAQYFRRENSQWILKTFDKFENQLITNIKTRNNKILLGTETGLLKVYHTIKKGAILHNREIELKGSSKSEITAMDISADGLIGIVGNSDGSIQLWNLETGEKLMSLKHPDGMGLIKEVKFSSDGKTAYTFSNQSIIIKIDGKESLTAFEKTFPLSSLSPKEKEAYKLIDVVELGLKN